MWVLNTNAAKTLAQATRCNEQAGHRQGGTGRKDEKREGKEDTWNRRDGTNPKYKLLYFERPHLEFKEFEHNGTFNAD